MDFDVLMNAPDDVTVDAFARDPAMEPGFALSRRHRLASNTSSGPRSCCPAAGTSRPRCARPDASGNRIDFAVTPLNMLVDSPLDMGRTSRNGTSGATARRSCSSTRSRIIRKTSTSAPSLLHAYERMPAEAFAMYGSRHFADYHALLTLSDAVGFQGIEHHQSSDNRAGDDFLTDPDESLSGGDLIPHEFSHSWNGKYRRPADLTTPNFQVPQLTDLLWVYEGMNQYLGDLLSFRCRNPRAEASIRNISPRSMPSMDYETGRATTPLIDLTTGAPYYYEARGRLSGRYAATPTTSIPRASWCGSTWTRSSASARTARARSTRSCTASPSRRSPDRSS